MPIQIIDLQPLTRDVIAGLRASVLETRKEIRRIQLRIDTEIENQIAVAGIPASDIKFQTLDVTGTRIVVSTYSPGEMRKTKP